jgi:hypothetical protein
MSDQDKEKNRQLVRQAEHLAELHRLHDLGLVVIDHDNRAVVVREPSHPRVMAWRQAVETVGQVSDRAWLLFEVGQLALRARDEGRPRETIDRILDFGATILPTLSEPEVKEQLDALVEKRGMLH